MKLDENTVSVLEQYLEIYDHITNIIENDNVFQISKSYVHDNDFFITSIRSNEERTILVVNIEYSPDYEGCGGGSYTYTISKEDFELSFEDLYNKYKNLYEAKMSEEEKRDKKIKEKEEYDTYLALKKKYG